MARKKKELEPVARVDAAERQKALAKALGSIQEKHGMGSIMKMGERQNIEIEAIPTGALSLDVALGIGGVPRGRIIEIYGPESSGKTTVALHIVAEAQKRGGIAAFVDAEHALDPVYAGHLGVDVDNLILSQPDYGEQALQITEELVRSGAVDVIVIDSVAALVPKAEIDGEVGDTQVGLHARLMSQALRRLTPMVNRSETVIIFINQIREKIGQSYNGMPSTTTTGGRALKFYASVRIEVKRKETITEKGKSIGNKASCRIQKNKLAPPFRVAEFDLLYGKGIARMSSIVQVAADMGVIRRSGSWFYYGDLSLGQGSDKAKAYLEENPELCEEICEKVYEQLRHSKQAAPLSSGEEKLADDDVLDLDEEDLEDEEDILDLSEL